MGRAKLLASRTHTLNPPGSTGAAPAQHSALREPEEVDLQPAQPDATADLTYENGASDHSRDSCLRRNDTGEGKAKFEAIAPASTESNPGGTRSRASADEKDLVPPHAGAVQRIGNGGAGGPPAGSQHYIYNAGEPPAPPLLNLPGSAGASPSATPVIHLPSLPP